MATQLSDIVQHDKEFLATVFQKVTELAVMRKAGIVMDNAALSERANGPGKITSIPAWNPLTQNESNVSSDDPATTSTPDKITQVEQLTVINERNRSWSSMDLVAQLLADDPMGAIAARVGEYWARDEEHTIINILKGILAENVATNGGDMVYSTGASHDASAALDLDALVEAAVTAGDAADQFDTLICHSRVYANLQKAEKNSFIPASETNLGFGVYGGKYKVIVSDNMPLATGVYTSMLLTPGLFGAGEGSPKVPLEHFRAPAAGNGGGQDTLYNRRRFILHPSGMKFVGTPGSTSPTNAEFATAGSWARAYDRKNVGVAYIKSNG